jgi:hypothetical protein
VIIARKTITTEKVGVDDIKETETHEFYGRNVRGYIHADQYWLYTLSDSAEYYDNKLQKMKKDKLAALNAAKKKKNEEHMNDKEREEEELFDEDEDNLLNEASTGTLRASGLYIYDLTKML